MKYLLTFIAGIDQMITFFEEHLWVTASASTTGVFLTADWHKNIIGTSVTASNWEIFSKNIS